MKASDLQPGKTYYADLGGGDIRPVRMLRTDIKVPRTGPNGTTIAYCECRIMDVFENSRVETLRMKQILEECDDEWTLPEPEYRTPQVTPARTAYAQRPDWKPLMAFGRERVDKPGRIDFAHDTWVELNPDASVGYRANYQFGRAMAFAEDGRRHSILCRRNGTTGIAGHINTGRTSIYGTVTHSEKDGALWFTTTPGLKNSDVFTKALERKQAACQ